MVKTHINITYSQPIIVAYVNKNNNFIEQDVRDAMIHHFHIQT
jgi:hypothetical protein